MTEALFELLPAALLYRRESLIPFWKMRCRDCHIGGRPITGSGCIVGYAYALCSTCAQTELGRVPGSFRGRELIVIEDEKTND